MKTLDRRQGQDVRWRCVSNCGACCHLDPTARPDLENYLTAEELKLYLSMVGEDGWCVNFDRETRKCQIYTERPRFCRVKPDIFEEMYQVTPEEFDEFAIACCHEQIIGVYGEDSPELQRYQDRTNHST
ncbi:YkgJ family cysteine cluster protein [Myxosarcina sp. GI1]|uniref:YkgJ family cysteine cluster protein n=1 Tax=Myxosarcina sp. GI1 TaxID=1541065 RepID=UPI00055ABC8A|nr:YkgJ family cysteine cluster protein [Myxosarcina sp. GI1]